jgi:hypothetical protein
LLRYDTSLLVDCFQDRISAAPEQRVADGFSEINRVVAVSRLAQNLGAIRIGDDCFEVQSAVSNFGERADRDLATSTEFAEKGSFAGGGSAGRGVVQEQEMLSRNSVSGANFDS